RRARKKKEARRWLREAQAILLLAAAGFGLVALATFDPALAPGVQRGPVGPVGVWLGWAFFRALGYAGFLFPLLLVIIALSAFMRPLAAHGWAPFVGLGIIVLSATGLLAETSSYFGPEAAHAGAGGAVGWGVTAGLQASLGEFGTWLVLVAGVPIGVLFITQVSYSAVSRMVNVRLKRWRRSKPAHAGRATAAAGEPLTEIPAAMTSDVADDVVETPPPPVVVEPRKRATASLAWQETFDFGKGGAESFQLPATGLLHAPDGPDHTFTNAELQDNAETLRKKLLDFEVEGRIVQVSPGPIITSYEFEPAAGVKISRVVNLADDLALGLKAAAVRIVGPIPGRGTVAIEVPNAEAGMVYLREIFASADFVDPKKKLPLALGKDVTGGPVVSDLTAMPHLLVAGATGTGKSVGLNVMICSILYRMTPAEVRFLLIDPTQRPSVDVVTGLIKANFPTRIAFQMASKVDSRTVLDANGAEQLLGRGDMIFVPPGANKLTRVHGAWVSDEEVKAICEFLRKQGRAVYEEVQLPTDDNAGGAGGDGAERDDLYWDCVRLVIGQRAGSISFLQRRMGLGYPKAARFIDMMEQDRIIGPGQGAKPREILVGPEYLQKVGR